MVILLAVVMTGAASPMNRRPMGLLSRFRQSAAPPPAVSTATWRKAEYFSAPLGHDTQLLYAGGAAPAVLPAFALEFAAQCIEFAPLESHLADYATQHALGSLELSAVREWLPRLIEAGALISSEQVIASCTVMRSPSPPPPIELIGFPTGGPRGELLGRAVESFAENLRTHGRSAEMVVADSSRDPTHRAAFRAQAAELSARLGIAVHYSGEEERVRFAAALVARGACSSETIEFALLDPLAVGFACGANRNALLLHGAGRMLCSVDDDVICRLAAPPELRREPLSLFSNCDPLARWLFPDRESALREAQTVERDFLGAHEELLGRGIGDLFPTEMLSLEDAGDDILKRLAAGPARIRASYLGHFGDPGIPSSCYYLNYERASRARMLASEEHYRAVLGSRSVFAAVPALSFGDASVSPGMAMGLDHRELLPPFFPVFHAEDFIHGITTWQCCTGAVAGHQPLAVLHAPPAGKPILQPRDLGLGCRVVIFEFAHLLRRIIRDFEPVPHAATPARIIALGRFLSDLAARPAADFVNFLRQKIFEHESERLGYLDKQLELDDLPDFFRRDVEDFLLHAHAALAEEDFDIPHDLKAARAPAENRVFMQQLIARYGRLLEEWPAIVEATAALREAGVGLIA
jgi:hypothetical protein